MTLPDPLPAGSDPTLDRALEVLAGGAARRSPALPDGRLTATRPLLHSIRASSTVSENERR